MYVSTNHPSYGNTAATKTSRQSSSPAAFAEILEKAEEGRADDNTNKGPLDENGKFQERFPWEIAEVELSYVLSSTASRATSKMMRLMTQNIERQMLFGGGYMCNTDQSSPLPGVTKNDLLEYDYQYKLLMRKAHDEVTSETGFYLLDQNQVLPEQRKKIVEDIIKRFKEYPQTQVVLDKLGMTAETSYGLPYNPDYPVEEKVVFAIVKGADFDGTLIPQEEIEAMMAAQKTEEVDSTPKNGVPADDEPWLPDRLKSVTLSRTNTRVGFFKVSAMRGDSNVMPPSDSSLSTYPHNMPINLCPQWYADLAKITVDPSAPQYKEQMEEYYKRLKEAMDQLLDNYNIGSDEWERQYNSLIADESNSKRIRAVLLETLKSDPATVSLMEELGVSTSI